MEATGARWESQEVVVDGCVASWRRGVGGTRRALGVGAEQIREQMNKSDLQGNVVASSSAVVGVARGLN